MLQQLNGNVKKQLLIIVFVILVSLFFKLSKMEFVMLVFATVLIIIAEMINTAIETVVDLYTDVYHPKAKIAKDVGAGATVISAINAVVVAYFIFFDKVSDAATTVIESLINSPVHLAFTTIILTIIAILSLKAATIYRKDKGIETKFIPSGQTALAFAATVAIWVSTKSLAGCSLALILASLVAVARYDSKQRTLGEILFGILLGIVVAFLIYSLAFLIKQF